MQPRRLGVLAGLAVLALLLWFVFHRDRPPAPASAADDQAADPEDTRVGKFRPSVPGDKPPEKPAGEAAAHEPEPIIDEITVEKPEVCSGEENLITVRAHTENGTDPYLHYVINGEMGSSFPVRLWRDQNGVVGEHTITVFGRGNVATTVPLPRYTVKDCEESQMVAIETRLRPNTNSEFQFLAKTTAPRTRVRPGQKEPDPPPRPFAATSYLWSFGDGQTQTSEVPVIEHSYEDRPQKAHYSYFAIEVTLRAQDGSTKSGRTTLSIINPSFEALSQKNVVTLLIALTPRFPELSDDGTVTQQVRLWHHNDAPVTIERALKTKYLVGGAGESEPEVVDVADLLGATRVPTGRGLTTQVVLDTHAEPNVFSITYRVEGHSQDGYPVVGSFSVMRPPPRPTAANSAPVDDPLLKAKIIAARAILQRDVVSQEDLWRLEREGRFANLAPSHDPSVSPTRTTPQSPNLVTPPPAESANHEHAVAR